MYNEHDKRQKTKDKSQKTKDKRQKTKDKRQKSKDREMIITVNGLNALRNKDEKFLAFTMIFMTRDAMKI